MAPSRRLELQPPVSSSDKEASDSEQTTDSEDNKTPPASTKNSAAPVSASTKSDDDDSESDSDSDSDSDSVDPTIKPITSKPMQQDPVKPSTKKPRSKPGLPTSSPPQKSGAGAKRPLETDPNDSKRAKKKAPVSEGDKTDDPKKQLFQRLWSVDDEIVILKGIMDYVAKKGSDPVNDMNDFHGFIKESLHIDVSKAQLQDKIRRLKKKFENNARKVKNGKDRNFAKDHEQKSYDLSKKIWAPDGKLLGVHNSKVNSGSARKNSSQTAGKSAVSPRLDNLSSAKVALMEVDQKVRTRQVSGQLSGPTRRIQFGRSVGDLALEEEILKDGLELIEERKRVELEEKWKKLRVQEVELYLKRVELIREQTALVLEAVKSEKN